MIKNNKLTFFWVLIISLFLLLVTALSSWFVVFIKLLGFLKRWEVIVFFISPIYVVLFSFIIPFLIKKIKLLMQENFQKHHFQSESENISLSQKNAILADKSILDEKVKYEVLKEKIKTKELEKELDSERKKGK